MGERKTYLGLQTEERKGAKRGVKKRKTYMLLLKEARKGAKGGSGRKEDLPGAAEGG